MKSKHFCFLIILFVLTVILGKNYLFSPNIPLTADGHGSLAFGLGLSFRESILKNRVIPRWDPIGGTSQGELNPLPGSFIYPGIISLISPEPSFVLKITFLLPLLIAGLGMYYFIFVYTGNIFGSFLAGIIYAFNSYFLLEGPVLGHNNLILVYMLLPFLLGQYYVFFRTNSLSSLLKTIGFNVLIIYSDLQFALMASGIFVYFFIILSITHNRDQLNKALLIKRIGLFLFIIVFSLLLYAFQISSWVTLRPEVILQHFSLKEARLYSSSFMEALSLQSVNPENSLHFSLNIFHTWYFWLAAVGFIFGKKPEKYFFAFLYVFSLLLVMGLKSPIFSFLYSFDSPLRYFRVPYRFSFLMIISICLSTGYINIESVNKSFVKHKIRVGKNLIALLIGGSVIFLLFGFINGPYRGNYFQTFSLSQTNDYFSWIEQGGKDTGAVIGWLLNRKDKDRVDYFKLNPGGNNLSRLTAYYHQRRVLDGAQWHGFSLKLSESMKEINESEDPRFIANMTGILNIGYLRQNERGYLLETPQFKNDFQKYQIENGPLIFANLRVLPFLRTVNYAVLVTGDNAREVGFEVMKNKQFDPQKMLVVIDEKQDVSREIFNKFDLIINANLKTPEVSKVKDALNIAESKTIALNKAKLSKSEERAIFNIKPNDNKNKLISFDDTPGSSYRFSLNTANSERIWLILSEPFYHNWKFIIDGRLYGAVPAYGMVVAAYIDQTGLSKVTGKFYYGMSRLQEVGLVITKISFFVYLCFWLFLALRRLRPTLEKLLTLSLKKAKKK